MPYLVPTFNFYLPKAFPRFGLLLLLFESFRWKGKEAKYIVLIRSFFEEIFGAKPNLDENCLDFSQKLHFSIKR